MKMLRWIRAWWNDVPFTANRLWFPSYTTFNKNGRLYNGRFEVIRFSGRGSQGDRAGIFREDGKRHVYEITKRTKSSGSDYIVTPYRYCFEYVTTMPEEKYQQAQEESEAKES